MGYEYPPISAASLNGIRDRLVLGLTGEAKGLGGGPGPTSHCALFPCYKPIKRKGSNQKNITSTVLQPYIIVLQYVYIYIHISYMYSYKESIYLIFPVNILFSGRTAWKKRKHKKKSRKCMFSDKVSCPNNLSTHIQVLMFF